MLHLFSNTFTQRHHSLHGSILVKPCLHCLLIKADQIRRYIEVGKALAEVDRTCFIRKPRHDCKNGCACFGQLTFYHTFVFRHKSIGVKIKVPKIITGWMMKDDFLKYVEAVLQQKEWQGLKIN